MTTSVPITEFKSSHYLEIIRRVENDGTPIDIVRHGKVVARLSPWRPLARGGVAPWAALRGKGRLLAAPGESVISDDDFA